MHGLLPTQLCKHRFAQCYFVQDFVQVLAAEAGGQSHSCSVVELKHISRSAKFYVNIGQAYVVSNLWPYTGSVLEKCAPSREVYVLSQADMTTYD